MQIFESILEYLRIVGVSSNQSIQPSPFNARNSTCLVILGLNLMCNIGFFVCGAKDLNKANGSIFMAVTVLCILLIFADLIWRMKQFFEFLNHLDDIVTQSKFEFDFSQLLSSFFLPFRISSFPFTIDRIGRSNIGNNLHGDKRKNSTNDTNFIVCFASNVTNAYRCAATSDQFIQAFHISFGKRCIGVANSHVVS